MKKTTLLFALIISSIFYAQGKLHIHNYTNYGIDYTIWAEDEGCSNSIFGSAFIHGGESITYNSFNEAITQGSTEVQVWYNQPPNVSAPFPIFGVALELLSNSTKWKGIKFTTNTPNGGNTLGSSCNSSSYTTYISGANIPYTAYWLYIDDEYYVIIQ